MIFLIQYDRATGTLVRFEEFNEEDRAILENKRLNLELDLNAKNIRHEVVILEAESKAALQQTHRRYFVTLEELAQFAH